MTEAIRDPKDCCSNCRWWRPKDNSHLCIDGHCFKTFNMVVPKSRYDYCEEDFEPVEE